MTIPETVSDLTREQRMVLRSSNRLIINGYEMKALVDAGLAEHSGGFFMLTDHAKLLRAQLDGETP